MADLLTGADIRRFRKLLRLSQLEFAGQIELSQPTLSLLEAGRIALTEQHLRVLNENFAKQANGPTFAEFVATIEHERGGQQSALVAPIGRHLTLSVWRWREGWDLSVLPPQTDVVDLVTVPFMTNPAIAFAMPRANEHWAVGEILVFSRCERKEVQNEDVCLIQCTRRRSRSPYTAVALARHVNSGNGRVLQLEMISPAGSALIAEQEQIQVLLRVVYRARHI